METSILIYLYDIYASLRCFMAEFQLPSIVSPVRPRTNHYFFFPPPNTSGIFFFPGSFRSSALRFGPWLSAGGSLGESGTTAAL